MQFSVRRDQILKLLLDDFNQWLLSFSRPFFLFFSFSDNARQTEVEFVSNNRQYSTVTTIYARPRLRDFSMRNSIACSPVEAVFVSETPTIFSRSIFAKQRTYRGHRNYSASTHTSPNALREKKHTTEAKYSFAIFTQIFYFLFVRRVYIFLKYWDRLRGKIYCTRMKMTRKLKRDKN